jgi:hypothetical protein
VLGREPKHDELFGEHGFQSAEVARLETALGVADREDG